MGRLAGNTKIIYTALKVRQRGFDLGGKSEKWFKEVSSTSGGTEGYFSNRHKQCQSWAWWGRRKSLCSADTKAAHTHLHKSISLPRLEKEYHFRGELRHKSVFSDLTQDMQKVCPWAGR